ncbi:MAG: LLM class flavin-dependent oxidoreductase, partial [Chloroflexota bacterium]|nr:LLM class flavin-dependent oxidoreductase [Chloroflexota bacterium]
MKLCFFHLMPYQDLPDNFEKDYHSVWVDAPNSLFDPEKGHRMYNDFLDELEYAEAMGFDAICVNEHHGNAYGMMPSPNLMASAMIRATSKAAVVVLGNSLALYNPPVRVAEEMAMLDVMSGGRLIAGFPLGTSMDTIFGYGQVPATLREKYQEAHDLVIKAWKEREPFAFNGKFTQL